MQVMIVLVSALALLLVLIASCSYTDGNVVDLNKMSDEQLDQAMDAGEKSALAGQVTKIPIQCSIVGDNLVLSRGNISRSLPRFFCSAREGNAQRERICGRSGYTSTLTRCENGCDGVTGKCVINCPNTNHYSINVDISARNGTTYYDFECYPDYFTRYEGYFLTSTNQPISILPKTCGNFNILVLFFDSENNRNLLIENEFISVETREELLFNFEEGLTNLFESYTPENVFESIPSIPPITFDFEVRLMEYNDSLELYNHDTGVADPESVSDFTNYDAVLFIEDLQIPPAGLGIHRWLLISPLYAPVIDYSTYSLYNTSLPLVFQLDPTWLSPGLFYNELFRRNVPVMLAEYIPGQETYETIGGVTYERTNFYNPRTDEAIDLANMASYFHGWYDLDTDSIVDCVDPLIASTPENLDGDFIPDHLDPNLSINHKPWFTTQYVR